MPDTTPGAPNNPMPPPRAYNPTTDQLRAVVFRIERQPDGNKYPSGMDETFELESTGKLKYGAYFHNMPINLNHNDSVEWDSGDAGRKVLEVVRRMMEDPAAAQLERLPDDQSTFMPGGNGRFDISMHHSSWRAQDHNTKAYQAIEAAFSQLLVQFEKATGRPRKPTDLPQ